MKYTKEEQAESKELLLKAFEVNNTKRLYVIQHSVSTSGMTRKLSVLMPVKSQIYDGEMEVWDITKHVACILGWRLDKDDFLIVAGCGMNMHFHTIYELSSVLYGKNEDGSYSQKGCYKLNYVTL